MELSYYSQSQTIFGSFSGVGQGRFDSCSFLNYFLLFLGQQESCLAAF
jgi:hypothetical protein